MENLEKCCEKEEVSRENSIILGSLFSGLAHFAARLAVVVPPMAVAEGTFFLFFFPSRCAIRYCVSLRCFVGCGLLDPIL